MPEECPPQHNRATVPPPSRGPALRPVPFSWWLPHMHSPTCREHGEGWLIWPYYFFPYLCGLGTVVSGPLNSPMFIRLCNEGFMCCKPIITSLAMWMLTDGSCWHSLTMSCTEILSHLRMSCSSVFPHMSHWFNSITVIKCVLPSTGSNLLMSFPLI